jgi:enolase-phosphatase E1
MFVLTFDDQLAPETILFLSDNVKEVEAAISAGMKSLVVDRPGNAVLTEEDKKRFEVVDTFEKISLV